MENEINIAAIRQSGIFNNMDLELGRYVTGGNPEKDPVLFLAGALASWAVQHGHSCCDLNRLSGKVLNDGEGDEEKHLRLPVLDVFSAALVKYPEMAAVIPGRTIRKQPLVLDSEPSAAPHIRRARHPAEKPPDNKGADRKDDDNDLGIVQPEFGF